MKTNIKKYSPLVLPSNDEQLYKFIESNKVKLMEGVLNSIEFAINKNLAVVEVFSFENSEFVITLANTSFQNNINHICDYYLKNEEYELCERALKLKQKIEKTYEEKKKS